MDRRDFVRAGAGAAGIALTAWATRLSAGADMGWAEGMAPSGSPAGMPGSNVAFDRMSLFVDGQRKFILSASLHYFRLPDPGGWKDRIAKLKDMGFNAIDTYYYWAYHSPAPGKYDFTGPRDVDRFHDLVEDAGMYLIVRPGPYICAEVNGGGLPGWLIADKKAVLRCRGNGKIVYDPEYMRCVREWYEQIVPRIARRKNLILFQIENEYNLRKMLSDSVMAIAAALQKATGKDIYGLAGSLSVVKKTMVNAQERAMKSPDYLASCQYMRELYKMSRELQVAVPIFHNDASAPTTRWSDADILGVDDYPVWPGESDWRRDNPFSAIDMMEEGLTAAGRDCPLLIPEIQGGWYDGWGGHGYGFVRDKLGPDSADMTLKSCLAQGAAVLNMYMAFGGTTWGYLPSPDVYTSYDYGSPISEGGAITARAHAIRHFADFAFRHEADLLAARSDAAVFGDNKQVFVKARRNPNGELFVFLRNLSGKTQEVELNIGARVKLEQPDMQVLVFDRDYKLTDSSGLFTDRTEPMKPTFSLPTLGPWEFSLYTDPLDPKSDGPGWKEIAAGSPMDIDSLGIYYGHAWYRGRYDGALPSFKLDARHCWSAWLDGEPLMSYNNFVNRLGANGDAARTVTVRIPERLQGPGEHVLVILVESLGHNKGFFDDFRLPRGIVRVDTGNTRLSWSTRAGLLPGEPGITPALDPAAIPAASETVTLPHKWPAGKTGIGIYTAAFTLDLPERLSPVGLRFTRAPEKALIFLNGNLIGLYWDSLGPQKLFFLMPPFIVPQGENKLTIAVWPWQDSPEVGPMSLEVYP
jgi:hypothetical protein